MDSVRFAVAGPVAQAFFSGKGTDNGVFGFSGGGAETDADPAAIVILFAAQHGENIASLLSDLCQMGAKAAAFVGIFKHEGHENAAFARAGNAYQRPEDVPFGNDAHKAIFRVCDRQTGGVSVNHEDGGVLKRRGQGNGGRFGPHDGFDDIFRKKIELLQRLIAGMAAGSEVPQVFDGKQTDHAPFRVKHRQGGKGVFPENFLAFQEAGFRRDGKNVRGHPVAYEHDESLSCGCEAPGRGDPGQGRCLSSSCFLPDKRSGGKGRLGRKRRRTCQNRQRNLYGWKNTRRKAYWRISDGSGSG